MGQPARTQSAEGDGQGAEEAVVSATGRPRRAVHHERGLVHDRETACLRPAGDVPTIGVQIEVHGPIGTPRDAVAPSRLRRTSGIRIRTTAKTRNDPYADHCTQEFLPRPWPSYPESRAATGRGGVKRVASGGRLMAPMT
jgi:hypothetical protein